MRAVGVANPRAQGQAMTSTDVKMRSTNWNGAPDIAQIIADNISECAYQHGRSYEIDPALRDRHTGGRCRSAYIGIRSDYRILKIIFKYSCRSEAEDHIHEYHDERKYEQKRALGDDGIYVSRHTYDEQEHIDTKCSDFLRPMYFPYTL